MATQTLAPVSMSLSSNSTSAVVGTILTGKTNGIKVTQIKFEDNTTTAVYLTPNGGNGGRHFYIDIRGSVSGSIRLLDIDIASNSGRGLKTAIPNSGVVNVTSTTILRGNIELVCSISATVGAATGFIGQTKVTLTYTDHPTVSAGSVITKAQMDTLRSFLGGGPTAVTQYDTAKASVGNTYKNNLTAGTSKIEASWYNGA